MEQSFTSHHLPCLSGSSQTPLILTSGNENSSSERSTPVSVHSLHFNLPLNGTKQTSNLQQQQHHNNSNNNIDNNNHLLHQHHQRNHQQQQQQQQHHHHHHLHQQHHHHQRPHPSTPLILNSVASAHNNSQPSIFFPPDPVRSSLQKQQHPQQQQSSSRTQFSLESAAQNNNKSPGSADINMNADSERNREASRIIASTNISPSHNIRLPSKQLNSNATSFPGIFQEHSLLIDPRQASRRSVNLTTSVDMNEDTNNTNTSDNNNCWPQQKQDDENYHLYHEPIDPDDQEIPLSNNSFRSQTLLNEKSNEIRLTSPDSIAQIKQCPPPRQTKINQRTSMNVNINANNTSAKEWSFVAPNTPSNDSPTVVASDCHSNNNTTNAPTSSTTPDNVVLNRRDDVSADIYRIYVTLKSPERANHRSRSYHGPKNTNLQSQPNQTLYSRDNSRNLSSTSIADLPTSPSAMVSTPIPIPFRDHCVRELIETETNYVHALNMILTCFAKPLEPLLRKEDYKQIFGDIKYFHHIHSSFQVDLVKAAFVSYNRDVSNLTTSPNRNSLSIRAVQSSNQTANSNPPTPTSLNNISQQFLDASPLQSPVTPISPPHSALNKGSNGGCPKISSCFLNIKDKFLKYGEYCSSLSRVQALLDELANKNENISAQLERCQQDANEGKFKLRDLLSLPMQRILKYHLLLAQLIKNDTSSTNEDYHGLQRAHEAMLDLGQYINEVKRDTEALQIIDDIEKTITDLKMPQNTQLSDYGRLVTDGFIRIKVPHDSKTRPPHDSKIKLPHDLKIKQKRYVFVFDKVMLMCKISGVRGYQYKEALVLSEYEIDVNPTSSQIDTLSKHATKEKWSYNFNLIRSSDKTVYSFYAKTLELKNNWVDAIQKAMDNIRPAACRNNKTNHEFLMHTFDRASSCDHCGKLLLGLYYQGYRCRTCFTSAHKGCIAQTRSCGPKLPPKLNSTLTNPRARCDEPPSPSRRSNCSDDSHHFIHFPPSNSSSTQCVNAAPKNEYSNIDGRTELTTNQSSSFRDNSSRSNFVSHRPVSSMINVSHQNSTNHLLLQRRRMLKGSSTPTIGPGSTIKAKALSDYEGNESNGHLKINFGDILLVCRNSMKQSHLCIDGVENSLAQLKINSKNQNEPTDDIAELWFGKNTQTGKEGLFPSHIVKVLSDQSMIQLQGNNQEQERNFEDSHEAEIRSLKSLLKDCPWYHGRMERDKAQAALENMPHGTFLVRLSTKHNGNFVISLNHSNQVKHMRIHVKDDQLCLSHNRYFKSISELVSWYERNSLSESFHMLDAKLAIPYKSR